MAITKKQKLTQPMSFIKKGMAAQQTLSEAKERQELAEEQAANRVYRFRIPEDEEGQITFIDGGLTEDGLLDLNIYYEHTVYKDGSWNNHYPCVGEDEICPICQLGTKFKPALVAALTIIDHRKWEDAKGAIHKNERKLFVMKMQTIQKLQRIAKKRGGLIGCTFDVSRGGNKSASVGDTFEFVERRTLSTLRKMYKPEVATVIDYSTAIIYVPASKLRALGLGNTPIGADDEDDYQVPKRESKAKPKHHYNDDDEEDDDDDAEEEVEEEEYEEVPAKNPRRTSRKAQSEYDEFDDDIPF